MKICVCFKIVPDLDQVLDGDWKDIDGGLDTSYVKKGFNCFDESALEMALRIREALEESVSCTAVTVGGGPLGLIKGLYAVGFDRVVNIALEDREFCPERVAALLYDFIQLEGFDLVLTGLQAGMADTGMIPPLLAESLGWPLIEEVVAAMPLAQGICFTCESPDSLEMLTVEGPVVASVGDARHPYLRVATLRQKMASSKIEIECFKASLSIEESEPPRFNHLKREKNCRLITGQNTQEKAACFFDNVIKGVLK